MTTHRSFRLATAPLLALAALLCHCSSAEPTVVARDPAGASGGDPTAGGAGAGDDPGGGGGGGESGGSGGGGSVGDPVTAADAGAGGGPRTCADVRAASGVSADGVYAIDPDGAGPIAAIHVYCAGMEDASSAPREYVELAKGAVNDSVFAGGGYCDCPAFVRTFTKVRFLPSAMLLDTSDVTFSTANRDGACDTGKTSCQGPSHTFFATPGSCVANDDASGTAHVDLSGTEIHLAAQATFGAEGFRARGTTSVSADAKHATVTGGGACGYWSPSPAYDNRLTVARD